MGFPESCLTDKLIPAFTGQLIQSPVQGGTAQAGLPCKIPYPEILIFQVPYDDVSKEKNKCLITISGI